MGEMKTMRIMVLGKTGVGKSSLANTICGVKDKFKESASPNSETKQCWAVNATVYGRSVRVIDTPGLFDTDLNSTELSNDILMCIKDCAPGPHAFLIVLEVKRYTEQEQNVVDIILKYFSEEALQFTSVVFTYGDQLKEGMKIKDWAFQNKALKTLIQKCGGRVHVFDNKYWNNNQDPYRNNQVQVQELLNSIDQKNGKYYTNKYLEFLINNMKEIRSRANRFAAMVLLGALVGTAEFAGVLMKTMSNPSTDEDKSQRQQDIETDTLRIVLLGKCGSGKSSLGNTIFGEKAFKVNHDTCSLKLGQSSIRQVNKRYIQLVDTPGISDTEHPRSEFLDCMHTCSPGPHALLLVLKVERVTQHEKEVVDIIVKYFSKEALNFSTVVFTHGNELPEGSKIKEWISENKDLKPLVQKCGGRVHVFDNKYWNNSQDPYRNNQVQVLSLLQTIEQTVKENKGRFYSNDVMQRTQQTNYRRPRSCFRCSVL